MVIEKKELLGFFKLDFIFLLPEIFFSFSILFSIFFFVILGNSKSLKKPLIFLSSGFFSFFSLVFTFLLVLNSLDINSICFNFHFNNTFFSNSIKILLLLSSSLFILFSFDYLKKESFKFYEFYFIVNLAILGMLLLICSFDFISFYLALELQSLSFYILASFKRNSNFSVEAGLKYFILGSLSSCVMLLGISLIYGFSGITCFGDFDILFLGCFKLDPLDVIVNDFFEDYKFLFGDIYHDQVYLNGIFLGVLFFSIGLFFKLGAAPFHIWVPDVYEGVPLIVTTFFAIIPKIIITNFILIFFSNYFHTYQDFWCQWFIFVSIFSFFLGSLGALYQLKIKRLLAYSAINHVGFLCLGLSLNTVEGVQAIYLYILIYILLSFLTFSLFLSLRNFNNNLKIKNILELKNMFNINPILSIFFCLTFFSIAGIPPLMGFFSKFYIFLAALKANYFLLVFFALFISVISSFYYIRIIKLVFFEKKKILDIFTTYR